MAQPLSPTYSILKVLEIYDRPLSPKQIYKVLHSYFRNLTEQQNYANLQRLKRQDRIERQSNGWLLTYSGKAFASSKETPFWLQEISELPSFEGEEYWRST